LAVSMLRRLKGMIAWMVLVRRRAREEMKERK
jgi:hypothetical protein